MTDTTAETVPASPITPDIRAELRRRLTIQVWSSDPTAMTVASVMGWSRSTAYGVVKEGRLPSIKISRARYAVSTAALLQWLDGDAA